jgi:3',5'-cyclic AMP phosphodiesterase CpdA
MSRTITIAHISDLHLGPPEGFAPRYWNLKRLLGYLNWLKNRRHVHVPAVAARLLADIRAQAPDHLAVTGDLVNIGLPREHENALSWLGGVGPPDRVTVVPGNHDIYSDIGSDPGVARWRAYMASDTWGAAQHSAPEPFPFLRRIGEVAIVGVNSSVPTPPVIATGRVGAGQIERLGALLRRLGQERLFRLVLIHHPPLPNLARPSRALNDAAGVEAVLREAGAELVVHGHNHTNTLHWVEPLAGTGATPVVGIASGSAACAYKHEPLARYNLYRISAEPGGWQVEMIGRGLAGPGGPIVELERRNLAPAMQDSHAPPVKS